ncbi:MAG: tetratricopeptide repeat-containing sulfotransferase family protein [Gammaproteobacteria bacterium]
MPTSTPIVELIGRAISEQQRGRFTRAEPLFNEVLRREPAQPDALHFLGLLEFQTGRSQSGLEKMRRSVQLAPRNAGFAHNLASALLSSELGAEAIDQYHHCLELEPGNADACQGLAMALSLMQRPVDAVSVLLEALGKHSGHRGCWMTLSIIQENMGMMAEAVSAARHALKIAPQDTETQVRLATLLLLVDRYAEAGRLLDATIAAAPRSAAAHFQRANLCMSLGQFADAQRELETVLALDDDYTEAYLRLSTMGRLPAGGELQKKLEARHESREREDVGAKLNIEFALGKSWQNAHDYARAFQHYAAGHALRRTTLSYSSALNHEKFQRIRAANSPEFLQRAARCGLESSVPIFIVGMARSGTSLVEQILSRHPEVHAGGELKLLLAALSRTLGAAYNEEPENSVAGLDDAQLRRIGLRSLADMQALAPGVAHITDKMPGNFLRLGLIHVLYPQARILHCYRDPRDNCVSLYTTLLDSDFGYTSDLKELGEYYCEYHALMQYWHKVLPVGTLLNVSYEDMVADTETQVRRILAHCRLEWSPACLDFTGSQRPVRTASVYQVRQPVYHSSVGRWKHYKPFLAPLLTALEGAA